MSVLGPLGNGFDLTGEGPALVVGGGIGAAPLAFVATALAARGQGGPLPAGLQDQGAGDRRRTLPGLKG